MASGAAARTAASSAAGSVISTSWSIWTTSSPRATEMVGQPRAHEAAATGDQGAHDGSPYWLATERLPECVPPASGRSGGCRRPGAAAVRASGSPAPGRCRTVGADVEVGAGLPGVRGGDGETRARRSDAARSSPRRPARRPARRPGPRRHPGAPAARWRRPPPPWPCRWWSPAGPRRPGPRAPAGRTPRRGRDRRRPWPSGAGPGWPRRPRTRCAPSGRPARTTVTAASTASPPQPWPAGQHQEGLGMPAGHRRERPDQRRDVLAGFERADEDQERPARGQAVVEAAARAASAPGDGSSGRNRSVSTPWGATTTWRPPGTSGARSSAVTRLGQRRRPRPGPPG